MNGAASPETDIVLSLLDDSGWHLTCPPRLKGHALLQGCAGLVAGVILVAVGVGGIVEAAGHDSWGLRVFLYGWLGPLAIIGVLLIWLAVKLIARLWQTVTLESDGEVVRHRTEAPWGEHTVFQVLLSRLLPFLSPDGADETARSARAPLVLRYRTSTPDEVCEYQCILGLSYEELTWIARSLNPIIEGE